MKFSRIELRDLAICWLALGFCFSLQYLIPSREIPYSQSLAQFAVYFGMALIGIGTGFLFHELAHKGVAQRFGYHAEFRMWKMGLIIAVASALLSFGRFFFFAPGAVYTSTYKTPDPNEEGLISAAGPANQYRAGGSFLPAGRGYRLCGYLEPGRQLSGSRSTSGWPLSTSYPSRRWTASRYCAGTRLHGWRWP